MTTAIKVEGLGKKYRLVHGREQCSYHTLRESLVNAMKTPFRKRGSIEEFWALSDVSFEVQPGEVMGVIGRNGAGKSTLLKILSRITKPTQGRVEINGRVGSLLEVGTGFHPELTGRENIYLNGAILGMSRREIAAKFDEIVAFAEVESFLDMPVKRYSSGMYVRLAFAVAAHLEPEILIVDEVLAVGDAGFQHKCLGKMRECAGSGRTVLLVSHQAASVRDLCRSALWLESGRVRRHGSAARLLDEYVASADRGGRYREWQPLVDASRTGNGNARFERVRYYGISPNDPPRPGSPLHVEILIRAFAAGGDAMAAVRLADRYGTTLIDLHTMDLGRPLKLTPGLHRLAFSVDALHLTEGRYRMALGLGSANEHYDQVSDAIQVEVIGADAGGPNAGLVTRRFSLRHTADIECESAGE